MGCPIRISAGLRLLAPHRSFSQRATSFIASQRQGIHRMPFETLDRSAENPCTVGTPPEDDDAPRVLIFARRCHKFALGSLLAQRRTNPPSRCQFGLVAGRSPVGLAPRSAPLGETDKLAPSLACDDGGADRDRTDDLKLAKLALSQLSYGPDPSCTTRDACAGRPGQT